MSKLPDKAKKVFNGVIFDVYQWEQEMYDGSTETFEMLGREPACDILAISEGKKILLSHQSQPNKEDFYSLFGGRIEEQEEPLIGAKRELLEESGYESDEWELLRIYQPVHKIDWSNYFYIARNCKKTSDQKLDSGEKIEIIECDFDEFIRIVKSEKYSGKELVLDIYRMEEAGELEEFKRKMLS